MSAAQWYTSTPERWYGADPAWRYPLERDAKRRYGADLRVVETPDQLTYIHDGIFVRGREEPVPIEIKFHRYPPYNTYGLAGSEYPRVFADPKAESKHRMPDDDALCLYYVRDDDERRWRSENGLQSLIDLVADHLCFEDYWRMTGTWLGPEAPHGIAA